MLESFILAFIPLFFAIDPIGVLPVFASMTKKVFIEKRLRIINQAVVTGFVISVLFILTGKFIFKFLGITISDFKIAGGILLLIIAINDLLFSEQTRRPTMAEETMGVVPIGMPLIIGPAVLTTLLLAVGSQGYGPTFLALVANLFIIWIVFRFSDFLMGLIGEAGATAFAKVFALLLTAIGVMMVRIGMTEVFQSLATAPSKL